MGFWEPAREVVVAGAAAAGAYAALSGVSAWRRQMRGKTEYEVGLTVLRAVYRVREAISLVRQPFMSAAEMSAAVRELEPAEAPQDEEWNEQLERGSIAAYQVRWRSVSDAVQDLDVAKIEGEVVWGNGVSDVVIELRRCVNELHWALDEYLRERQNPSGLSVAERRELKDVVFGIGGDKDVFDLKVNAAITGIEQFVRPRMGERLRQPNKRFQLTRKKLGSNDKS